MPITNLLPDGGERVFSPAKLNLFLHITGKRQDGYHNLQTVFVALDFGDELVFFENGNADTLITLTGACELTDNVNDNLIVKAGNLLAQVARSQGLGKQLFNIKINLTKKIPTGAGLGGGSSNAGTTLVTLNRLWQLNFDKKMLIDIAVKLGADIPFFVITDECSSAIGEGVGEILTPIHLPSCRYLLLFPQVHSSTASFFANSNLIKDTPNFSYQVLMDYHHYLYQLNNGFFNAFEPIAKKTSNIDCALTYLYELSAHTKTTPRLTGTGSTVFLPLPNSANDIDDKTIYEWLKNAPCAGVICRSLT